MGSMCALQGTDFTQKGSGTSCGCAFSSSHSRLRFLHQAAVVTPALSGCEVALLTTIALDFADTRRALSGQTRAPKCI